MVVDLYLCDVAMVAPYNEQYTVGGIFRSSQTYAQLQEHEPVGRSIH